MKPKFLYIIIIFALILTLTACIKNQTEITEDGSKIYHASFVVRSNLKNTRIPKDTIMKQSDFDKNIKKNFGLKFDFIEIPDDKWAEEMNIIFASGKRPDVITGAQESEYRRWGLTDYLSNIDINDLPNYKKLWTENELNTLKRQISAENGQIFYLPGYKQEKVENFWSYRADVLSQYKIATPTTSNEFYNMLKRIKTEDPDKIVMSGAGNGSEALAGIYQMFWMPANVLSEHSYIDPITGDFVPFAFATSDARDMFKFINRLYKEDLIDRELLTITKSQFERRIATGHIFAAYGSALTADSFTHLAKLDTPDANWQVSATAITAYPGRGIIYEKESLYNDNIIALGCNIDKEQGRRDAILRYIDWCASDEGQKYTADQNPDIKGIVAPKLANNLYSKEKGNILKPFEDEIMKKTKYYFFDTITYKYDNKEQQRKAYDLEMALINVREQYLYRFFIGQLDPNSNNDWNRYINDLKKAGLDEFSDLRTAKTKTSPIN